MGLIEDITQLMLHEGEVKAQQERERIAAEEELRQNKHRVRNFTLKALATVGPQLLNFIPGIGPLLAGGTGMIGMNENWGRPGYSDPEFLNPSQNPNVLVTRR